MPHADRAARLAYGKRYYEMNKKLTLKVRQKHYADNAERIRAERALKRTAEAKAKAATSQRARYRTLRQEVIAAYGATCGCCGETEPFFLELDHIDSDGASHRRLIGRGSHRTYNVLKQLGWPKDSYRLLCANCNQGRARNKGVCPHVARAANSIYL